MSGLAYKLYLLFVVSWFLHLPARIPILGAVRFDLVLVAVILLLSVLSPHERESQDAFGSSTRKVLWTLIIYILFTIPLVQWPGTVVKSGMQTFIKGAVFFFFTVKFIDTERRLKVIVGSFLACQLFRVLEPLYLHFTQGYWGTVAFMDGEILERLAGAPLDSIGPNGLAWVVLTVLPFAHHLARLTPRGRLVYVAILPILLYALALTSSRSGLLGLFVVGAGLFYKSTHKAWFLLLGTAALSIGLMLLNPSQVDRYRSIFDSDSKNAGSAQYRREGLRNDFKVIFHKPLFGHGLGTSLEANVNFGSSIQLAHNLYIEVGQELGLCGLTIFLLFIRSIVVNFSAALKILRQRQDHASAFLVAFADSSQIWLLMNLFFSLFSYGLHGYQWYLFGGLSVVLGRLAATPLESTLPQAFTARDVPVLRSTFT